ncbi:MAG: hypothetical protein M9913_20605 [Bryobacteraceae bacterium]|nr:hypothetical protein [Solibacteraceae bacterium]MCO5353249.1 hypothetical protein [Bryobacteraceae bacterium]
MLTGIILTRGALEVAEEVRRYLELEEDNNGVPASNEKWEPADRLEFAVLLEEAGRVCRPGLSV